MDGKSTLRTTNIFTGSLMKQNVAMTISSLVAIVLFPVHLAHDIVFGLDSMTRAQTFTFLLIMLVALYGTVELPGRRSGFVIMLIVGIAALGMPVLHIVGGPRSAARGFFFVWTLLALGGSGVFSATLAARELWRSMRATRRVDVV
jgi:hypothetical protein